MEPITFAVITILVLSIVENNQQYAVPEPIVHIDDAQNHSSLHIAGDVCPHRDGIQQVQVCENVVNYDGQYFWIENECHCRQRLVTTEVVEL